METIRRGLRARARWGDEILAESTDAVRVGPTGGAATLWFPAADVRFDGLAPGDDDSTWSATGPAPLAPDADDWHHDGDAEPVDPAGVARGAGGGDPAEVADHVAFDHDRVLVEIVEERDPGLESVVRCPDWGDVADLVDVLDVRPAGDGVFESVAVHSPRRPVVEGSQMLAQTIVAACRRVPGRRVVSAHVMFLAVATTEAPLRVELDELSGGRSFTSLAASVFQGDRRCAAGTLLLGVPGGDVVRHAEPSPDVGSPAGAVPYDMSVTGRELRIVDDAYTDDPDAPVGPPVIDAWVRFRDVPDDQAIHAGLLAQFTGHMSIAAALRPHAGVGQRQAHRTISTAPNAISISFHRDVRADAWMRYRHLATVAEEGMTHSECRVHDDGGVLVASFTVDAMVRPLAAGGDHRTAL